MTSENKPLFKGPQFYFEEESSDFKGRDKETADLLYLVEHSDFSVCYAVSGEGKSSLINAGLCPKLRDDSFLPIHVKNIADKEDKNFDKFVWEKIENAIKQDSKWSLLKMEQDPENKNLCNSVWWKLRTNEIREDFYTRITPVLIFDQFEEVFTKDLDWTFSLFKWLEELYNDVPPQDFQSKSETFKTLPKKFKALFSLRSEYVCELDYWSMNKFFIPSLKNNRYYLKPLTKVSALEVAKQLDSLPRKVKYDSIISYAKTEHTGKWGSIDNDTPCVSALILSLILTGLSEENSDVETQIKRLGASVDEKMLFDFLLDNVYEKALHHCNPKNDDEIKNYVDILEDKLIDEGRRCHVSERELPPIPNDKVKDALNKLKDDRVINVIDGHYEISHDSLCPVIQKRKEQRIRQRMAEEAKAQEKAKRKKILTIIGVSLLFVIVVLGLSFIRYQYKQNWKLQKAQCRYIAATAENMINDGDSYLAQLLILEGLPEDVNSPNRPYTPEAEAALRKANMCDNAIFYGHKDKATVVAFSPDDRYIASGSDDCTIRIWEVKTGLCVDTLIGHSGSIDYIGYSSGDSLLFSKARNSAVCVWNLSTGKYKLKNDIDKITKQTTWLSKEAKERLFKKSGFECKHIFVSPGGNALVALSEDKEAIIWDIKEEKCLCLLNSLGCRISPVFSDDGALLAIFDLDDNLLILDVRTGNCLKKIQSRHLHYDISHVSFSHDKRLLSAACTDGTIRVWDLNANRKVIHTYEGTDTLRLRKPEEQDHIVSSNGKYEATVQDNYTISVIETKNRTNIGILVGHTADISSIAFSPDGNLLASASWDATIRIWDLQSGECKTILYANIFIVNCVQFSSDGKKVVSCSGDFNTIRVWDVATGICLFSVEGTPMISDVCFSNEDKQILFKSFGSTKVIDFPPLQELIDQTRERFKDRKLTPEERRKYYLE